MWSLRFTANDLINGGYALYLMTRRGTFRLVVAQGSWGYFSLAVFMGIAWQCAWSSMDGRQSAGGAYGAYTAYPMFLGA